MKILVTGGCGFIGVNLVRFLLQADCDCSIVNFDKLTYAACPSSLADLAGASGQAGRYRLVHGDLAHADAVRQVFDSAMPDVVVHLAAESHVDRSIDGPADFVQTNVVGTFNLLDAARSYFDSLASDAKTAFRFLHVSTDEVFGSLGETGRFTESSPYDPHSPYSATKAASDHLARAWHTTYGLPVIVTNCSNNYGPYQFPEKLLPLMIIKCLKEEPLPVYGDGQNVRDWLFVEDHVGALHTVLKSGKVGETYNIGGGCERRNIDLVHALCDVMDGVRPRKNGAKHADLITFVNDRPGHDFRYAIDSTKIQNELGWKPQHTLESALRRTVDWYLTHPEWWQAILDGSYQLQRLGQSEKAGEKASGKTSEKTSKTQRGDQP